MIDDYSVLSQEEFNQIIDDLGPWGEDNSELPPIAIAVSGGADSLCLALMASRWRHNIIAFIVDHRIRSTSTDEAIATQKRLSALSIPSKILTLTTITPGSALEERARMERYRILEDACCEMGCVDLLLGHHAGDQAETVLMRIRAGSGHDGLAGIALITELPKIRLVRPLLSIFPQRLRQTLRAEKLQWIEDPSNQDTRFQRNQLRSELSSEWRKSGSVSILLQRSYEEGIKRMEKDQKQAVYLAENVQIRPEGFAILPEKNIDERTLGALIRTISGSVYMPLQKSIHKLAQTMRKITLGGIQIIPAGRMGRGWLMIREEAAIELPKVVLPDILWDQRFRVILPEKAYKENIMVGALGKAYQRFSNRQGLPATILRSLPAFWLGDQLLAVPHLGVWLNDRVRNWDIIFQPKQPATQSYLFSTIKFR